MGVSARQTVINQFNLNQRVLEQQTDGLTHEDSLLQLPFRGNCLNWVLGHLAMSRDEILQDFGQPTHLTAAQMARYDRGSEPITDGTDALPMERLLAVLKAQREQLAELIGNADEAFIEETVDEARGRSRLNRLQFAAWHEGYHTGQTEILRQLAGKNDQIIK